MLAVDQMIPEQLERLAPQLEGGLGRLYRQGTVYRDAMLPYARTETGAGHVTFSTGCLPRSHGVVGNGFWDRGLGREVYCVEDLEVCQVLGSGPVEGSGQRSPKNLDRPTIGEIMQAKNPASRVVSISAKDRAAIGMAGRSQGLVLWWDKNGGGFQTSTFYSPSIPDYVSHWNDGWLERNRGFVWEPVGNRTERDFRLIGSDVDDREGERPFSGLGVTFPYSIAKDASEKAMGNFAFETPLCDRFVAELAREAIRQESLGADDDVDLLCVSFSSCDVIGHANGPFSREVTDVLFRLDRELGLLFDELDKRVGADRWALALTADHGILPLPEYLRPRGVDAFRVPRGESSAFRGEFVERLQERLGSRVRHRSAPGGFRLDEEEMKAAGLDPATTRQVAAEVCREVAQRYPWVQTVYSYEEIQAFDESADGLEKLLRNSFQPDRTADLVVVNRPYVLEGIEKGTNHGSPHEYDRRIPLVFYGAAFPKRISSRPAGSQDVVPTLLGLLGVPAPGTGLDGVDLGSDL
ncbi:alkaline phosphatase family protein [Saltatorellus ferox]